MNNRFKHYKVVALWSISGEMFRKIPIPFVLNKCKAKQPCNILRWSNSKF